MIKAFTNKNLTPIINPIEGLHSFFQSFTPESAYVNNLKIFQGWVLKDCQKRVDLPNEEVALFLDQLNSLVAAAYIIHQENRVLLTNEAPGK
jgi:hypothetical protein